jgi:3-phenylpropionate/trans-cinnamate dioxygenase ferredoxin reductase component
MPRAVSDRTIDVLLIGGGIASASAASELRERGFDGSIVLATRELDPPYHRPPITKGYLQGRQKRSSTLVHPERWYADHDVELLTRTSVIELEPAQRTAKLGREVVGFDQALMATGAMVRRLRAEGAQREGIHYLRALANADTLREAVAGAERIAVVGGSYIATEVAASLTLLGKRCTIVMQETLPLERGFGAVAGGFVRDLLEEHGIEIVAGADVVAFDGDGDGDADDGEAPVGAVICEDGRRIAADLVVVGSGATPDVMLARKAGLEIGASGGVACDARLRTSAPAIFAAGDMCEYDSVVHGRRLRIEHEEVAAAQGRSAARAMLGSEEPFADVPYFWSDLADWATLEYVGPAHVWDEEIVRGDPAAGEFSVWFLVGGRLAAALAVGRSRDLDVARSLLARRAGPAALRGALEDPASDLASVVGEQAAP